MRKVLLCSPYGGIQGGISRWTGHIIDYYNMVSANNIVISLMPMGRSVFVNLHSSIFFRLRNGMVDFTKIMSNYFRQLKHFSPDIVHLTTSASLSLIKDYAILKFAKYHKAKTIIHFRFGRIPDLVKANNWEWKLIKIILNIADCGIVIDQPSFDALIKSGFSKIKMIPNPVAPTVSALVENFRGTKREPRKLLFAGHVVRSKGIFELVEACCDIPDITLKIIGRSVPEIKKELMQISNGEKNHNWLEIPGEMAYEDVIKEMISSGIFILPTYTEGFPNVILESMACGCPIIASSVGAIPEMLDEESGILVEPGDVLALKAAINSLLSNSDLANKFGDNAKKRVHEHYSMTKVWDQLSEVWLKI